MGEGWREREREYLGEVHMQESERMLSLIVDMFRRMLVSGRARATGLHV